jgi:hypothetical protein
MPTESNENASSPRENNDLPPTQPRNFGLAGLPDPVPLKGPWAVSFPPDSGAPESLELAELASLHRHPLAGVRYFSGTATYRTEFTVRGATAGREHFLDLGHVEVMAEVLLNGANLGSCGRGHISSTSHVRFGPARTGWR